jgi:hypothetical protein
MKINFSLLYFAFLILFFNAAHSQITITKSDIARANDTIRVSTASNINSFNYELADTNYFWDFFTLESSSQRVEEYISVFRTGITYNIYFADLPFNPNRANVAQQTNLTLPAIISNSDSYNFFDRNDNELQQVGIGTTLNGIETAIRFDNNDIIYKFPLQYGNLDTSDSDYDLDILGLAYYRFNQTRINEVDGWGTIVTPLDTFDAIRVKTTLIAEDSLYIDTLNFGFNLPRGTEIQYKWLAPGRKIPVLQINTRSIFGNSFVTGNFYQDKKPAPPIDTTSGIFEKGNDNELRIYPNPATNRIFIDCECNNTSSLTFTDMLGKIIHPPYVVLQNKLVVDVSAETFSPGFYSMQIVSDKKYYHAKVFIQP